MFELTADHFLENKDSGQYKVSIQISLDGFSFLVTGSNNEILASKTSTVKISSPGLIPHHFIDWAKSEPFLKLPFKEITLFVFEELFTLIPQNLTPNRVQDITKMLIVTEKESLQFDNPAGDEILLRFSVLNDLVATAKKHFTDTKWIHPVSVILNHLPESQKPNISCLIRSQNRYFFIIRQRSKLLLANCFTANHPNDVIYQVINTFQQLKVSRNLTQLFIADTGINIQKTRETLEPYFAEIAELTAKPDFLNESGKMHYYLATHS